MRNSIKGLLIAVLAAATVVAAPSIAKAAWDPADYTGNGQPQFNVYKDVPNVGNEQDFITVGKKGDNVSTFTNDYQACEGEARYSVYIHNGAPEGFNGTNNDGTGVAKNTKLAVQLQTGAGSSFGATAVVSASNAASVSDTAKITCNGKEVELEYVPGSATIFSQKRGEAKLSDAVVNGGTLVGTYADDGVVPGCWDFRVYVSFDVKIKEKVVPPKPPVTPPATPTTPTTLPSTGAGDVVTLFSVITIAGAIAYRVYTVRRLSRQ